jgi:hypothetical protein
MEVRPRLGVGPFVLGDCVCEVLKGLEGLAEARKVDVGIVQQDPMAACFVLEVAKLALRLVFEPVRQVLVAIEVMDVEMISLSYRGKVLSSGQGGYPVSCRKVCQLFGPTKPIRVEGEVGVLEYRGCAFVTGNSQDEERLVQRMFVYAGSSFRESVAVKDTDDVEVEVEAVLGKGIRVEERKAWITFDDYAQDV